MKIYRDGGVEVDGKRVGRVIKFTHCYNIFVGPPGSETIFVDGRCGWEKRSDAVAALLKHVATESPAIVNVEPT